MLTKILLYKGHGCDQDVVTHLLLNICLAEPSACGSGAWCFETEFWLLWHMRRLGRGLTRNAR
jgi:hypothetical protein